MFDLHVPFLGDTVVLHFSQKISFLKRFAAALFLFSGNFPTSRQKFVTQRWHPTSVTPKELQSPTSMLSYSVARFVSRQKLEIGVHFFVVSVFCFSNDHIFVIEPTEIFLGFPLKPSEDRGGVLICCLP